jgi:hypothetical protein
VHATHRPLPYEPYPMLRAENGAGLIHPDDRKFGVMAVGGQGTGKTSVLLRMFLNDTHDPDAAPIVLDPKSELAHLCLAYTSPGCGKRVWYLDLGRPAFGMNPLVRSGERPLALEAAEVAENVVAALLDVYEDQLFASSRRYLYHAVIGALALADREQRRPTFEDVYRLLEPADQEFRNLVGQACADVPDLDFSAHFLRVELPEELRHAGSQTTTRMDAPRNKISTLLQTAPIVRFFHHPTHVSLRAIIEARDILIVDAAKDLAGDDNVRPMMLFMMRMLHRQMQRQVRLSEDERPRVPLIVDEAHYIAGTENFVDQVATHRRGGLEVACGLQFFAQLGSGSNHREKIRKGLLNLLQSRFIFRMGDVEDAEEATRIAMAVFSTMIRDDPDARARLRVTPEQVLNFPNHFCLASWIAGGTRIPSFTGQTYPFPPYADHWARWHLTQQAKRVAPYPERLDIHTLDTGTPTPDNGNGNGNGGREDLAVPYEDKTAAKRLGARWDPQAATWFIPAGVDPAPFARWRTNPTSPRLAAAPHDEPPPPPTPATGNVNGRQPPVGRDDDPPPDQPPTNTDNTPSTAPPDEPRRREVRVDYEPPPPPPKLDTSPVRRIVGHPSPDTSQRAPDSEPPKAPQSLRELAFLDRINEIGPANQRDGANSLPRLYDQDYAILALLDRAGLANTSLIGRATMPGRAFRTISDRLVKLHQHGLIARHATGLRAHSRDDGKPPLLFSLTARGLRIAQERSPAPAISPKREWRPIEQHNAGRLAHDLHALSWGIELHRLVGDMATDHWRTPRYATGRYPVPQVGFGRDRHPITANDLPVPAGQAIIDLELKTFTEVKPDLSLELRLPDQALSFDLLVELDLTARASYNHDKFLAYDAFLCGWSLGHRRFQTQGTRPAVVFISPTPRAALALAKEADEAMTGRIGVMGTGPEHWYHPGRDHLFFAVEADLYHGDVRTLALPPRPPGLRERLTGSRELELTMVDLLPRRLLVATE